MTPREPRRGRRIAEIPKFLELRNLGLNLPFALAFLFVAARGWPSWEVLLLVLVAFVAARNAGHSFNRWADRRFDAANPRTEGRALAAGRVTTLFALTLTGVNGTLVIGAAYLLNPLAFALSPIALALVLGYSYTKRITSLTTAFLGLVEGVTPAAIYIAIDGRLPVAAWLAVGALIAWGTAFETVHSVGDLEADERLGLRSLPRRLGRTGAIRLVAVLHASALGLLFLFGVAARLPIAYDLGLGSMAVLAALTDRQLARHPEAVRLPFERHFALGALYLAGTALAVFGPFPSPTWRLVP